MRLVPPLFRWVSASATGIFRTEPLDSVNLPIVQCHEGVNCDGDIITVRQ